MGKFSRRLFVMIIVSVFALVIFGGGAFYVYIYGSVSKNAQTGLNELAENAAVILDQHVAEMDRMALYLSANSAIKQAFHELGRIEGLYRRQPQYHRIGTEIITVIVPNSAQKFRVCAYGPGGDYVAAGNRLSGLKSGTQLTDEAYAAWYANLPLAHRKMTVLSPHGDALSPGDSQIFYSVIREIVDVQTYKVSGLIEVQCPYSVLEGMLAFSEASGIEARVYDSGGGLVFPLAGAAPDMENMLASATDLPYSGWRLELLQSKAQTQGILVSVSLVLVFACLTVANPWTTPSTCGHRASARI
jgi:hypothetical protein